jgi:hypothetical protein
MLYLIYYYFNIEYWKPFPSIKKYVTVTNLPSNHTSLTDFVQNPYHLLDRMETTEHKTDKLCAETGTWSTENVEHVEKGNEAQRITTWTVIILWK